MKTKLRFVLWRNWIMNQKSHI